MSASVITAGIDVGSSTIKVAVLRVLDPARRDTSAEVLALVAERVRRRDARLVIDKSWQQALAAARLEAADVAYVASTGEGELVEFRRGHFYGMTTHARGALFLLPEARAVLDVGALHARAILMDERAKVLGYRMTSQCASGSGQFLESIARYLGVAQAEIGALSLASVQPETVSSICAVLAETDVINMVSRGISAPDILRGLHDSMAGRLARLLQSVAADGVVFVSGGLSADDGLAAAIGRAFGKVAPGAKPVEIRRDPLSVYAGAIGAAIWGTFRFVKLGTRGVAWKQATA